MTLLLNKTTSCRKSTQYNNHPMIVFYSKYIKCAKRDVLFYKKIGTRAYTNRRAYIDSVCCTRDDVATAPSAAMYIDSPRDARRSYYSTVERQCRRADAQHSYRAILLSSLTKRIRTANRAPRTLSIESVSAWIATRDQLLTDMRTAKQHNIASRVALRAINTIIASPSVDHIDAAYAKIKITRRGLHGAKSTLLKSHNHDIASCSAYKNGRFFTTQYAHHYAMITSAAILRSEHSVQYLFANDRAHTIKLPARYKFAIDDLGLSVIDTITHADYHVSARDLRTAHLNRDCVNIICELDKKNIILAREKKSKIRSKIIDKIKCGKIGSDVRVIVRDSILSGNCKNGTLSFISNNNILTKSISVRALLRIKNNSNTLRAAYYAIRRNARDLKNNYCLIEGAS